MYFIYVCIWKRWIQNKFVIFPMMSFALMSPKKCNVHLCQKLPFVHACFQTSAAPPPENSESDEKGCTFWALFTNNYFLFESLSLRSHNENKLRH
jgi:hypothetical protein